MTLSVSVVLATRNRVAHAIRAALTILANSGFDELLVIDQSDGYETAGALGSLRDPRVRYIRTATRGVTTARNLGIAESGSDIVAFTDDDCRVAPDWVQRFSAVFAGDPDAAVVSGRVRVPPEIQPLGFTENFEPHQRVWQHQFPPFGRDWGITANMAIRRSTIGRVGGFDPFLGAGAPLRSGGEPDFLYRVLRAGCKVINASEVVVDHLGVRAPGRPAQQLMRGYGAGTAAAFFKHVRLGDTTAMGVYLGFIWANIARIIVSLVRARKLEGAGYLLAFMIGTLRSCRYRVDPNQRLYVAR